MTCTYDKKHITTRRGIKIPLKNILIPAEYEGRLQGPALSCLEGMVSLPPEPYTLRILPSRGLTGIRYDHILETHSNEDGTFRHRFLWKDFMGTDMFGRDFWTTKTMRLKALQGKKFKPITFTLFNSKLNIPSL
jgi:hypothetical protein